MGKDYPFSMSLTEAASGISSNPENTVREWICRRDTLEFLGMWESVHNPDFRIETFGELMNGNKTDTFDMTPEKWITEMNSTGIWGEKRIYAVHEIALEFSSFIFPEYRLYMIENYLWLLEKESADLPYHWNSAREVLRTDYQNYVRAAAENVPPPALTTEQLARTYDESDLPCMALFGKTESEWSAEHGGVYIREAASVQHLLVLMNLESLNIVLIGQGKSQSDRLITLHNYASQQMKNFALFGMESPFLQG